MKDDIFLLGPKYFLNLRKTIDDFDARLFIYHYYYNYILKHTRARVCARRFSIICPPQRNAIIIRNAMTRAYTASATRLRQ